MTPFTAADKTAPGIDGSGTANVAVETLAGAPGGRRPGPAALRRRAPRPGRLRRHRDPVRSRSTPATVAALAADPAVVSVEPWVAPELLDERAAQIVAANLNGAGTAPTGPGYLALPQRPGLPEHAAAPSSLDITDEGIDKGIVPVPAGSHPDFYVNGNAAGASRIDLRAGGDRSRHERPRLRRSRDQRRLDRGGLQQPDRRGVRGRAGLQLRARASRRGRSSARRRSSTAPATSTSRRRSRRCATRAYAAGARISNNSWGANVGGAYNADSREFDFLVRDAQPGVSGNQQMTNVFSAGNVGPGGNTIGAPGTAKNVITVGASENVRPIGSTDGCGVTDAGANNAKDIINFSSRGPTDDGRMKPDVVAPGTHVTGAQPQTGADYNGSGTCNPQFPAGSTLYSSSRAPRRRPRRSRGSRRWSATGTRARSPPARRRRPAMMKAIMVNTATDVAGGADGAGGTNANVPTQIQGWGRVNLRNIVDGTAREFVDQDLEADGDAASATAASTGCRERDQAAQGDAGLDRRSRPDLGQRVRQRPRPHRPRRRPVVQGQRLRRRGSRCPAAPPIPRNNVENVFLPAGDHGPVRGRRQRRRTSPATASRATPTRPTRTTRWSSRTRRRPRDRCWPTTWRHRPRSATTTTAIEPGERFNLSERAAQRRQRRARPGSARCSPPPRPGSPCPASILAPTRTSPRTRSGPTRPRSGSRLGANSFPCGDRRRALAAGDDRAGQSAGPVQRPDRRAPGAPVNHNSTDVPKAIPDQGTVESNLNVGATGADLRLNVRIPSLTHTFDGDL